jgi:hypothetical protein
VDAALVGAWCTGISGIIGSIALLVKIVTTRPRLPVAEEVLLRLGELEDVVLLTAGWLHTERTRAAAAGYKLGDPPARLLLLLGDPDAPPGQRRRTDRGPLVPVPPRGADGDRDGAAP